MRATTKMKAPVMRQLVQHAGATPRLIDIATETGPLAILHGRRVLVLLDVANLTYGARDAGLSTSYRTLAAKLSSAARACSLHAFMTRVPGDERGADYLRTRGWTPHAWDIETVRTRLGTERRANADNFIIFGAGVLASRSSADVVVIGTGDGDLACDLARALASLPGRRSVVSLSLAGSTSFRLDARRNPFFTANIELGQDCLRPMRHPRRGTEWKG